MPLHSYLDYPFITSDFPSARIPTSDILTTFSFEYTPSVSVTSQPITLISASFEILIEERAQNPSKLQSKCSSSLPMHSPSSNGSQSNSGLATSPKSRSQVKTKFCWLVLPCKPSRTRLPTLLHMSQSCRASHVVWGWYQMNTFA